MKLKRQSRFHHEVSTGALNDIMFFLLLFFLIVSTVANPTVIKLMLPKASETESVSKQQIVLAINSDKVYQLDGKPVHPEGVEEAIRQRAAQVPDPTLVLQIDRSLEVQALVDVMDMAMRLHVKMVLQTKNE